MNGPRRLGFAMHAFPRRFRAQRSDEIAATFDEADLAGDADAYGPAALIDVVFAGWGERARTRPPLGAYLKYRLLGGRLEQRWHSWMLDDLDGWFALRRAAWVSTPMVLVWAAMWHLTNGVFVLPPLVWLILVTVGFLGAGIDRRRTLKRHGYDPRTRTWVPPTVERRGPTTRRIPRAAPTLTGIAAALLVVTPFATITLLFPDQSVQSVTIGSFSFERAVDHTGVVGWASVAVGFIGLAVGTAKRRWIADRTLVAANTVDPTPTVVVSSGRSGWTAPAMLVVAGLAASLLPIAPMLVPAAFLAAGCVSPVLLVLANTARRIEHNSSAIVGLSTGPHAAPARAAPH